MFVIFYTTLSFLRYDNFYTGRLDLGNMTQTVWNTAHGNFFQMTHPDGIETVSRLAFHADFILILFAPFYWIWDNPKVLLLFQAAIAGCGAIFIYLLTNHIVKHKYIAVTFAFAYLLFPPLGWSVLFDFHAVVLATTFLLGAVYFLLSKRYRLFLLFTLLAGLTKEQVWIVIALFGIILFFFYKQKLFGAIVFLGSLSIFYMLFWHAIPNAQTSQAYFALSYFDNDASSMADLIKQSLFHPSDTLIKLTSEDRVSYMQSLFMPLGYLSLLFPFWLFFAGADFALNLLSDKDELHQIFYHYTAIITPFVFLSAIYGVWVLQRIKPLEKRVKHWKVFLIPYILFFSLYAAYQYGPLPGSLNPNDEMLAYPLQQKNEFAKKLAEIPVNNSVAASNELGAQLSHRQHIYTLGIDIRDADYVAFFMRNPDQSELEFNGNLIKQLKSDPNFELWYDRDGLLIYRKTNL